MYNLEQWYSVAYCFVNTTYEDNYPTVNIEAQCCGTCVITYDSGGSGESVPEENIVPRGNVVGLSTKILNLSTANICNICKYNCIEDYLKLYSN